VIRTTSTDHIVPKDVWLPMIIVITLVPCSLYVVAEEEVAKPVLLDALCGSIENGLRTRQIHVPTQTKKACQLKLEAT